MILTPTGSPAADASPTTDVVNDAVGGDVGGAVGGAVGSLVVIAVLVLVVFICVSILLAKRSQQKSLHKVDSNGNSTLLPSNNTECKLNCRMHDHKGNGCSIS